MAFFMPLGYLPDDLCLTDQIPWLNMMSDQLSAEPYLYEAQRSHLTNERKF